MQTNHLTTAEAAALLGVSARRVRVLAKSGRLTARLYGATYVIDRASVEGYKPGPQGWPAGKKRGKRR